MISTTLPLPWTFDSLWVLTQLAVQVGFVTLIVFVMVALLAAAISNI